MVKNISKCSSCGANNLIKAHSVHKRPICGRCGELLLNSKRVRPSLADLIKSNHPFVCALWIVLIVGTLFGMGMTRIYLKRDFSAIVTEQKIKYERLRQEYDEQLRLRLNNLESELASIDKGMLKLKAEEFYRAELTSRQSFDSRFALSQREQTQLHMRTLASDTTRSFHDAIISVAHEAAPRGSEIEVKEYNQGIELHVYFDMSSMTSGEHGTRTKHETVESLKSEVVTLISRVVNDVFLFCKDLNLSTIHVGCRHYVQTQMPNGTTEDLNTVLYKIFIKHNQFSNLSSNPFLDVYSSSNYFHVDIDNFDTIEIVTKR